MCIRDSEDIDMAYQGDVEIIHNWREEHSIEDLQRLVERKGYSAISVGSFDHAALKKFPYQLTAGHCEPSPGYSNTLYIWDGRGGGGKNWDGFEDDESGALGIISSVQPRIIDSRLVLVRRGSPNVLRFDHWQALQAGGAAPLTCHASHPGNGIGKMYPEERRFEEWRYTESKCVAAQDACSVQLVQGKFLKRVDANLVLDVAFWKFHEGTAVNWVGGGSDDRTYLHGGGRDFRVNSDGSICLVNHPELCLGVIDFESQARLFRWRRWLSKVLVTREGVCSNDWPESPGDYPYEAFANLGKCRGGDFDEAVGTVADIVECWSRCQDLNEPGKTSYCASMHQTSMECSCQGADPDGDFDELECLEDVGEYTLAVHEGWRGSRCYGNDGRVCACDGGDYCLPWTGDYYLPWTWPHMAGPFKEGLLSYAFLAIGFSLLLGPGVSLKARVGLCWVAIPGLMAVAGALAVVAWFFFIVGIIVYRCLAAPPSPATPAAAPAPSPQPAAAPAAPEPVAAPSREELSDIDIKWCADVVARIEAIESTMEVRQNPPPCLLYTSPSPRDS